MTNNEAREYFNEKGLSYGCIDKADMCILKYFLIREFEKTNRIEASNLHLSTTCREVYNSDRSLKEAYLFVSSDYFEMRECISFNRDGFIGMCGWADNGNSAPIQRAFIRFCNFLDHEDYNVMYDEYL